jgi:hypothetical protein
MHSSFSHWSNFRYWLFHVTLNAAPSFIIACAISTVSLDARIASMIAGVVTFIAGYTLVTGTPWFRRNVSGTSFGTALKWATRIRSSLATIALVGSLGWFQGLKVPFLMNLSILEMCAGLVAGQLVESAGKLPLVRILRVTLTSDDASLRAKSWWLGDMNSAIPTYLWTLTEGIILSLLMATFAVLIWFSAKIKRRYFRSSTV